MRALKHSDHSIKFLSLPPLSGYSVSNPSVLALGNDKYFVSYKGVNYDLKRGGYFATRSYAGFQVPFSDAQNYWAEIDWIENPRVLAGGFIEDRHIRSDSRALAGLQDIRLFFWKDRKFALSAAVTYHLDKTEKRPKKKTTMLLCELGNNILRPCLFFPARQRHEKNWMPWVKNEKLYLQYHCDPFEVLELGHKKLTRVVNPHRIAGLSGCNGGSAILPLGNHYMGIVHKKTLNDQVFDSLPLPGVAYTHRVVIYSHSFEVLALSRFFTFEGERIEFCSGFAISEGSIVISYGVWDTQARLLKMNIADFLDEMDLAHWQP